MVHFVISDNCNDCDYSPNIKNINGKARLFLVSPNSNHIIKSSPSLEETFDQKNFATSIIDSFDILDLFRDDGSSIDRYLVSLDNLAYAKAGLGKIAVDLSDAISSAYGTNYVFNIDRNRSTVAFSKCKSNNHVAFFETNLTYQFQHAAGTPSSLSSSALPTITDAGPSTLPGIITTSLRRNFIVLAPAATNSYRPRLFNPKSGFNSLIVLNDSAAMSQPRDKHYLIRYDIKKTSPIPQLTYLIDSSAPEDIRTALIEGINWWDEAFQKV
jgi:hypothetical protein